MAELKRGQRAIIKEVLTSAFGNKLMEMGCHPGVEIKLLMPAPFGDPLAFDVGGYCLSMRKSEAQFVEVELIDEQH
ncbi:MAG: ferrous iron transport protein A [Bacteroidia bacterium]